MSEAEQQPWDLVVVGAGAAGLVAAIRAAELGTRTLLLEKNARPGVKILMSGGTRCNLTHATDNRGIIEAYGPPGRFLHSSLAALSVQDSIDLFEAEGVATKVEETGKIFPVSNKATDVLAALLRRLARTDCALATGEPLEDIEQDVSGFRLTTNVRTIAAQKVLITTGGQSFPGSGTTGDGYRFAAKFGHTIITPRPALTPVTVAETWARDLKGITIPDVRLRVVEPPAQPSSASVDERPSTKPKVLSERRGSLLFTHFGLSGPVVLDVSRVVSGHARPQSLVLECDFLPALSREALEESFRSQAAAAGKKQVAALLPELIPKRLALAILAFLGLAPERKSAELSKRDLARLVEGCKQLPLRITGTLGFKKAEVTAGGVALDEVDSRTLQSKLAKNLYLAGEVLDLDGPIGGYNFQAAWSTGWLAGETRNSERGVGRQVGNAERGMRTEEEGTA